MTNKINIAIIGVGLAGTAAFSALVKKLKFLSNQSYQFTIYLIEKNNDFGPGVAYGTNYPCNLLNTSPNQMGIYANKKDDFIDWLSNQDEKDISPVPRFVYGNYLKELIEDNIKKCYELNAKVVRINKEAIDIDYRDGQYCILYDDSGLNIVNYVFLCVGGLKSKKFIEFQHLQYYHEDPYRNDAIEKIKNSPGPVCIIGTSLSAIDAILMLHHNTLFSEKIYCISKSGRFPLVNSTEKRFNPKYITTEAIDAIIKKDGKITISQVIHLLRLEIGDDSNEADLSFLIQENVDELSRLNNEVQKSHNLRYWQATLYNTNNLINYIWKYLDTECQNKVVYDLHSAFLKYRAAMPLKTAKTLLSLMQSHHVVVAKMMSDIQLNTSNQFFFDINGKEITAKHLLNATGMAHDISNTENTLIKNLFKKGLISKNKFDGIRLDTRKVNVVDASNTEKIGFFAIGYLTIGEFFITNIVEHCVWHADLIVNHLIDNIHRKHEIINENIQLICEHD